jgi:S-adenosylmethionine synthetase
MKYKFTSESVSEGHPDKVADQISDAILDAYLALDKHSKVACETFVTHKGIIVAGEITSKAQLQKKIPGIVRKVITDIGYTSASGYGPNDFWVRNLLHEQSSEINKAVDDGGAGDQGLMFGYACSETPELMPLAIWLSHRIMERQALLRKNGTLPWLLPDAKSQVTLEYENDRVIGIDTIVVSTQHLAFHNGVRITQDFIREQVIENIIKPVLPTQFKNDSIKYLINPSGSFEIGGPVADTGLTGRKIIVDTYGGSCPHGGGAFSGKDPSKVDRSGAYAARYIAKNLVASGLCSRATVQISYAIGQAEPTSIMVDSHGTSRKGITDESIASAIPDIFPLRPKDIIQKLGLLSPIYLPTASYGHLGRKSKLTTIKKRGSVNTSLELFSWEKTDRILVVRDHFSF